MTSKLIALFSPLTLFLNIENILLSQIDVANNNNLSQSQRDLITKYVSGFPENTQLSIAFISNSNVNYVGIEKVDGKLLSIINRDSVFEIGSITKIFTSTILANLIKENVLNLNDPIETVLPYKLRQSVKDRMLVTYKTLANHTSGLPGMPDNSITGYDSALLRNYLQKELNLNSVPGEKYQYSNLGVGILGYLLEIKTGLSYEELLQEKIFSKYDMNSSTSELKKVKDLVVKGRDSSGNIIPNWQSDFSDDPEIDIWGYYQLNRNQIELRDIGGAACNNIGLYEYSLLDDKLSFKLINDSCDGRSTDYPAPGPEKNNNKY